PARSPDGSTLVFASDRGGIYDLYLLDLGSGVTTRLTRVFGAALEPTFTPEGNTVVFVSWEASGRAIRSIEVNEQQALDDAAPTQLQKKPAQFEPEPAAAVEPDAPKRYSPLSTLVPRFWMPTYVQASNDNLIGAWTADEDLLRHWFYSASLYYGLDSAEPRVFTTFGYSRIKAPALLDPLIFGSYSRNLSSFGTAVVGTSKTALNQVDVFELRETARLGLASGSPLSIGLVPIDRDLDPGLSYRVGFEFERRSALDDSLLLLAAQQGANPAPFTGSNLSGFFARVGLGRTKQSEEAISPELGLQVVLESNLYHESLGGDYTSAIFSGDVRGYIPVPFLDHHVIALRAAGGTTQGDRPLTRAFVLGGSLGQGLITLSGTRLALLRGFGESEFSGDHVVSGNAEYRMPLLRVRRGAWNLPIYLQSIHLAGFVDAGTAWDEGITPKSADVAVGAGAELVFDVILSYYLPTPVRVGVGRGLRVKKETEFYVRLGRSF
ncbi:MAG: BamA/TamA family outer membrane protein, partial [Chrysiogenetes bacterium]|nr:BamA/TamA family outer membrane protein [Chrysiogenetes bacterium]